MRSGGRRGRSSAAYLRRWAGGAVGGRIPCQRALAVRERMRALRVADGWLRGSGRIGTAEAARRDARRQADARAGGRGANPRHLARLGAARHRQPRHRVRRAADPCGALRLGVHRRAACSPGRCTRSRCLGCWRWRSPASASGSRERRWTSWCRLRRRRPRPAAGAGWRIEPPSRRPRSRRGRAAGRAGAVAGGGERSAFEIAADRGEVPESERVRPAACLSHAAATAAEVAGTAYRNGGGSAIYESSPLQRHFRDANAATQHMLVAPATWELTGRLLLGVETDTAQL